jgi:formamidopyrimidine-DNA glycosylase
MPELPEVENVKIGLQSIISAEIMQVFNSNHKLRCQSNISLQQLKNKKIISIQRRGRYLLIYLSDNYLLLIHLGMTGNLVIKDNFYHHKHLHFACLLEKEQQKFWLEFSDIRRFGFLDLFYQHDLMKHKFLQNLGPEPLDKNFNAKYLLQKLNNKNINIKTCLMDNKIVVGIGNIYVNEILFASKILPTTIAKILTIRQVQILVKNIKIILQQAIKNKGSSINNYRNANGDLGNFQQFHLVYAKKNCPTCKSKIQKITQAGRSSYFCQQCQF